jgi:hypothetical protein
MFLRLWELEEGWRARKDLLGERAKAGVGLWGAEEETKRAAWVYA